MFMCVDEFSIFQNVLKQLYIQLSGVDYVLYRFTKEFAEKYDYYSEEIFDLISEVEQWGMKLAKIAPVLKWDWDDDGYLVYIPYENSKYIQQRLAFLTECQFSKLMIIIYII